jgi:hypothetical protein
MTKIQLSNCLFYALGRYRRDGGCVLVLPSLWGWWPHFVWTPDMTTFWEFHPIHVVRRPRRFPPTVFWGYGRLTTDYDISRALYRSKSRKSRVR